MSRLSLSSSYSLYWGVVILKAMEKEVLVGCTGALPPEEANRLSASLGAPVRILPISQEEFLSRHARAFTLSAGEPEGSSSEPEDSASPEAPAVVVAGALLLEAAGRNASDLHLRLQEGRLTTELRVGGLLSEHLSFPGALGAAVIRRLLTLADLDPYSREAAQEGSLQVTTSRGRYDTRLSLLRRRGDSLSLALRLFPPPEKRLSLTEIALLPEAAFRLHRLASRKQGLLLFCGPTGSGKSTTVHALLRPQADAGRRVVTMEDPVEQREERFLQLDMRKSSDRHLILEAALRQDPDILFLGEVRSSETAAYAVEAALTGHLVLTTLHASSVSGAVDRLLELGVEASALVQALVGVVGQRLLQAVVPAGAGYRQVALLEVLDLTESPFDGKELTGPWWRSFLSRTGYLGFREYREHLKEAGYDLADE